MKNLNKHLRSLAVVKEGRAPVQGEARKARRAIYKANKARRSLVKQNCGPYWLQLERRAPYEYMVFLETK